MSALNKQVGGSHYRDGAIQPIQYIESNKLTFSEGSVVKYITRHRNKNGVQDLLKIIHYVELILEMEYGVGPDGEVINPIPKPEAPWEKVETQPLHNLCQSKNCDTKKDPRVDDKDLFEANNRDWNLYNRKLINSPPDYDGPNVRNLEIMRARKNRDLHDQKRSRIAEEQRTIDGGYIDPLTGRKVY